MVPLTTERLQGAPDYCNPALSGDMAGYANTAIPSDIITDFRLTAACIGECLWRPFISSCDLHLVYKGNKLFLRKCDVYGRRNV